MGLFSTIFGGNSQKSSSTQTSSNRAYDTLNDNFGSLFGNAGEGIEGLKALLGGDATGFNKYKSATGFNSALGQGMSGITGAGAAGGLLRSGGTKKGLASFATGLQNQFAGSYMDRLLAQANSGFQAGSLVSGAGNTSTGTSTSSGSSSPGIGGFLGSILGGVAKSDRRLKENVLELGVLRNGLKLYSFDYIDGGKGQVGVMAQEVRDLYPEALGPTTEDGYMTVDYDKIKELI